MRFERTLLPAVRKGNATNNVLLLSLIVSPVCKRFLTIQKVNQKGTALVSTKLRPQRRERKKETEKREKKKTHTTKQRQKSQRKCHKNPNSMMNSANKYLRQSKSTLLNTYNQLRKTFRRTPLKSGIACHFTG